MALAILYQRDSVRVYHLVLFSVCFLKHNLLSSLMMTCMICMDAIFTQNIWKYWRLTLFIFDSSCIQCAFIYFNTNSYSIPFTYAPIRWYENFIKASTSVVHKRTCSAGTSGRPEYLKQSASHQYHWCGCMHHHHQGRLVLRPVSMIRICTKTAISFRFRFQRHAYLSVIRWRW